MDANERLLKPGEVAELFGVDRRTVFRWAEAGRLGAYELTLGNHRRYRESFVKALLQESFQRAREQQQR